MTTKNSKAPPEAPIRNTHAGYSICWSEIFRRGAMLMVAAG